ncbi:MAG: glutamate 5-kinase [Gammaproteobacteria bacterium]|nr:glutamate 5-kinase [Gammaproteobacteria bacterium]
MRQRLARSSRWVIKIGSALATNAGQGLNTMAIDRWSDAMVRRLEERKDIAVVTSGAVAAGMTRLQWGQRPRKLQQLQAVAAVGQMELVRAWELAFSRHNRHAAQILLTHDDLVQRERYLNSRSTLLELLSIGVVPVINENDTVAIEELRVGDNDTLAGLVCNLLDADLLIILTDQEGLYSADPRTDPGAELVTHGVAGDPALEALAGGSGTWGRGGMRTKLRAAQLAARSGTSTIIASGADAAVIDRIAGGEAVGTLLEARAQKLAARKQWLAGIGEPRGRLALDRGAVEVLTRRGRSLLPVGVVSVGGEFARGELVVCCDEGGREVARGLTNYSAAEARKVAGLASEAIADVLGYMHEPELIHRDNLVISGAAPADDG